MLRKEKACMNEGLRICVRKRISISIHLFLTWIHHNSFHPFLVTLWAFSAKRETFHHYLHFSSSTLSLSFSQSRQIIANSAPLRERELREAFWLNFHSFLVSSSKSFLFGSFTSFPILLCFILFFPNIDSIFLHDSSGFEGRKRVLGVM